MSPEYKLREAITWMLREMERCPEDSKIDIANEALKQWETGLYMHGSYLIDREET